MRAVDDSQGTQPDISTEEKDAPVEEAISAVDLKRQIEGDQKRKGPTRKADSTDAVASFLTRRFG